MAKVKENKRNLSFWRIIGEEPQSDHVLRLVFFCKKAGDAGLVVLKLVWAELLEQLQWMLQIFGKFFLSCYSIRMKTFAYKSGSENKKYESKVLAKCCFKHKTKLKWHVHHYIWICSLVLNICPYLAAQLYCDSRTISHKDSIK